MFGNFEDDMFFKENKYNTFLTGDNGLINTRRDAAFVEYVREDSEKLETFLGELPYIARAILFTPSLFPALENSTESFSDNKILTAFVSRGVFGMWTDIDSQSPMFEPEFFFGRIHFGIGTILKPGPRTIVLAMSYVYRGMKNLPEMVRTEKFRRVLLRYNYEYLTAMHQCGEQMVSTKDGRMFAEVTQLIRSVLKELSNCSALINSVPKMSFGSDNRAYFETPMYSPHSHMRPASRRSLMEHVRNPRANPVQFESRRVDGRLSREFGREVSPNEVVITLTVLLIRDIERNVIPSNMDRLFVKLKENEFNASLTKSFKEYWERLCACSQKERAVLELYLAWSEDEAFSALLKELISFKK